MKLEDWLTKNPEKAKDLHERIGVAPITLWRYRKGQRKRIPNDIMSKIVWESDCEVTANDFYDIDASPKRRPGGKSARAVA